MSGHRRGLSFAVVVFLLGLAAVIISATILLEAFCCDRPDAEVLMHRSLAMAIPIFFFGAGVIMYGLFLFCDLGYRALKKKEKEGEEKVLGMPGTKFGANR